MAKQYSNLPRSIIADDMPLWSGGSQREDQDIEPDFKPHYDAWKAQDSPVTRAALLKSVQPVVDTAVYSYGGNKASPYVKTQAKLLAMDAFGSYDPKKGLMKTHLLSHLQRLRRLGGQNDQIITIPERVTLDRRHLFEAEEALRDGLGRHPSDMEISNHSGLSLKRIEHIRKGSSGINSGSILDAEGEVFDPVSVTPGNTAVEDSWRQMVYYDLPDTDRAVMDYTLGLHGKKALSNTDIAQKLGISPGAVSQRKAKIQLLLDQRYDISPFESN